ncbi:phage tail assembly chaperone family protein, TAC [Psychrobacter sp. FME13]|uniref:phage tail assembly chaperone family protein, TAC n=1 Tax=Psychrobacter sp. FME13 TaxID=2487708 RepID=UPI0017878037|nr:phage tail assembly chaperone family protein, TAC [Psychrobacter sp. FME13]MBE0441359.1 phage tail assembly chaperone family protein, TAC [Psychrobacter sp. FME13]
MKEFQLSDIKSGSLVSQVRDEKVIFWHNGEECSVDIRIKQLPFFETELLLKRMHDGESVASDWISKALVDDKNKVMFTKKQVEDSFVQTLASAIFDKVWDTDNIKKAMQTKRKKDS